MSDFPTSLAWPDGTMHKGTKCQIVHVLETLETGVKKLPSAVGHILHILLMKWQSFIWWMTLQYFLEIWHILSLWRSKNYTKIPRSWYSVLYLLQHRVAPMHHRGKQSSSFFQSPKIKPTLFGKKTYQYSLARSGHCPVFICKLWL